MSQFSQSKIGFITKSLRISLSLTKILGVMRKLNNLREVLKNQNRSQKWLSIKIGVSPVSVNLWCNNKSQPSLETLNRISQILGVKPSELIYDDPKEN